MREKGEAVLGELLSAWLGFWRGVRGFVDTVSCARGDGCLYDGVGGSAELMQM